VRSARMLLGGVPVPFQQSAVGLTLQLPRSGNEIDRVVVLVTGP
jgi:hypothetical protein